MSYAVAVDVGGTFTDVTLVDIENGDFWTAKTSSTPHDQSIGFTRALLKVLDQAQAQSSEVARVLHATTVATNAILEGKQVRVGLLTTEGFQHVLEIGRQEVPAGQTLWGWVKPARPVPPEMVLEIPERVLHDGSVLVPLDEEAVRQAARQLRAAGVQSIAVCFLHSYANPDHERRAGAIVREECPGAFLSLSCDILPKFREYERTMTTALNAQVMPHVSTYLTRLQQGMGGEGFDAPLLIMKSSGGVTTAATAAEQAIHTVLSGPTAGVVGAVEIARLSGFRNLISIDVGGTSADVCLVRDLQPELTFSGGIGDFPIELPMVDITTIGAGGGSIASVSSSGRLTVGPRSAGADPGPVCYGRGGTEPTLSDAYVVLGRIPPYLLGGEIRLDVGAAADAIEAKIARPLGIPTLEAAEAILGIATNAMASAIREVSIARGHDPRNFALVVFGGAGAMHGMDIAEVLGIETVLVPPRPGTLSTYGLLSTDLRNDYVGTLYDPDGRDEAGRAASVFERLEREAQAWFAEQQIQPKDRRVSRAVDARYEHQGFELTVPVADGRVNGSLKGDVEAGFHTEHERLYSYRLDHRVELVNARVSALGRLPRIETRDVPRGGEPRPISHERAYVGGEMRGVPHYARADLLAGSRIEGPAVVQQDDSTVWVLPGWAARSNEKGILMAERTA